MKKIKKRWWIIGGIVLLLIIIGNISHSGRDRDKIIEVQMEPVQRVAVEHVVSSGGNIRPVTEVNLSANVSAEILNITVLEGQFVQAGETLVILDSLQYVAAVNQARSAVKASEAGYSKISTEYQRGLQLFRNQLISSQEIEALEASFKLAEAEKEQSKAYLEQALDDLRKTVLTAPMSGTVTAIYKEMGEMVLGSMFQADVILTVADLTAMEVVVEVDETDVVEIRLDNPVIVEIDALPDIELLGKVTQIAQSAQAGGAVSSSNRVINFEIKILVDMNSMDHRIRPGMSATANITTQVRDNVIAIPIQALTARPEKDPEEEERPKDEPPADKSVYDQEKEKLEELVFIAAEPQPPGLLDRLQKKNPVFKVERRPLEIGISSANFYEVLSGLSEGEMLIVGSYKAVSKDLSDGSRVRQRKIKVDSKKKHQK